MRNLFVRPEARRAPRSRSRSRTSRRDHRIKNQLADGASSRWQPRLYNPQLHKWLHRIDVPTLLVWGDDDKIVPAAYGEALSRR